MISQRKGPYPLAQEENHAFPKQFQNSVLLLTFIKHRARCKNLKRRKKNENATCGDSVDEKNQSVVDADDNSSYSVETSWSFEYFSRWSNFCADTLAIHNTATTKWKLKWLTVSYTF